MGGCESSIEVFVKMQKKVEGPVRGCWMGANRVWVEVW